MDICLQLASESDALKQASMRRRMLRRLVFGLFLADFVNNLSIVVGSVYSVAGSSGSSLEIQEGALCDVQGFFQQMSAALQPSYIFSMALFMFAAVLFRKVRGLLAFELGLHISCWAVSIISAALPLLMPVVFPDSSSPMHVYYSGSGIAWCWVAPKPVWARFFFLYTWIWTCAFLLLVLYSGLTVFLLYQSRRDKDTVRSRIMGFNWAMKRLWLFPIAYAALWVLPTVNRISNVSEGSFWYLTLAEAFCLPLQGFVDAVLYGVTTLSEELRQLRKDPTTDFQLYAYLDQDVPEEEYPMIHAPRLSAWQGYYSDATLSSTAVEVARSTQMPDRSLAYDILSSSPYLGKSFERSHMMGRDE